MYNITNTLVLQTSYVVVSHHRGVLNYQQLQNTLLHAWSKKERGLHFFQIRKFLGCEKLNIVYVSLLPDA